MIKAVSKDASSSKDWFRVGRRVLLDTHGAPGGPFPAELLEDRGPIGADGRHVVRIAINPDQPEERAEFEVREDRILLDAA
jgi:hypothetical protein